MKKILSALITLTILLSITMSVSAEDFVLTMQIGNPVMTVNGTNAEIDPGRATVPVSENGRTLVPIRAIIEAMGGNVGWDGVTQTVTLTYGNDKITLVLDSAYAYLNGEMSVLDVVPKTINERTVLPIRYIAESFKFGVGWDGKTQTITISKNEIATSGGVLSATQISEKVSPSVFFIAVGDSEGNATASGSGFFINSDGVAVTNYHVIEGSAIALIQTVDGGVYKVTNVIAFDKDLDVAIIKVSKTEEETGKAVKSFPAVTLGNSDNIKQGQKIYTLGSPMGLQNTISDGIISNPNRENGKLIQITAPINHGSSGGALLDEYGEVLGITSSGYDGGNLNFAIPINLIKSFDLNAKGMTYEEFYKNDKNFVLELSKTSVELEVGESVNISVYAEGKEEDWSIYWDSSNENVAVCEWGEWSQTTAHVCPLKIIAKQEGTAVITVYSDVDFAGKEITVRVKKPAIPLFPNNVVNVPDYGAIIGLPLIDYSSSDESESEMYIYNCYDTQDVIDYMDCLEYNGFEYYETNEYNYGISIDYITPDGESLIRIVYAREYDEVWVLLPTALL